MAKINFNPRLCIGCKACEGACKQEYNLPVGVRWRVVTETLAGEYPNLKKTFSSLACRHCAAPRCAAACPVGAIARDQETGIVILADDLCTGCRACIKACPFGAISFDSQNSKAGKCTLCLHRLKIGLEPACVMTCMGQALGFER